MMLSAQAARMPHSTLRQILVSSSCRSRRPGSSRPNSIWERSTRSRPLSSSLTHSTTPSLYNQDKDSHHGSHSTVRSLSTSGYYASSNALNDDDNGSSGSSSDDSDEESSRTSNQASPSHNTKNNDTNRTTTAGGTVLDASWMVNLGRGTDNAWLTGPRPTSWYTGQAPSLKACPGVHVDDTATIRSLPLPNLNRVTRANARAYFDNSWTLYESLFAGLNGEEGFYRPPPHGLRHPQIFYYGHTACLYVNKLRVAGVLDRPVNAYFESIFEVGVDEMLWDDMHKNEMVWPLVSQVHEYRQQVYETVVHAIETHPSLDKKDGGDGDDGGVVVTQDHPMWALFMGFEHERIHLETSSVLFRETPLHLVQTPEHWAPIHPSARTDTPTSQPKAGRDYPVNAMVPVSTSNMIDLGKPANFPSFGWDNEYGERNMEVPPFEASKHMITNGEFYEFVADGGYRTEEHWSADGWAWRTHRNLKWPFFWQPDGPAGSHEYTLRTIFEVVSMPWNWPVDVTYYEAKAYCAWKSKREGKKPAEEYRLLTEAEHHVLRTPEHTQKAARENEDADRVMVTSGRDFGKGPQGANLNLCYSSQNPVDFFPPSASGHTDTTGSAWEWTEDHFNPLKGFEVHHVYDDFSSPCFDGKHSMIVGGSFISTGDEASVFARFHFRPHFLQHSGFRLVASEGDAPATHLYAGGNFDGQVAARDAATETSATSSLSSSADSSTSASTDNVYETDDSLHMYLGLHYPDSGLAEKVPPILPHDNAPHHGLGFPQRVVALLNRLKPESGQRALDIGCAVGGASFELAKSYDAVDAFDFSESFVNAARRMQVQPEGVRFNIPMEAELYTHVQAVHGSGVTPTVREKVDFFTGDACRLDDMALAGRLSSYDGVVMSNLLCRLPDPMACLNGLPGIINQDGVLVMVTPFSWLTEFTPKGKWLGGQIDPVSKEPIHSKDVLQRVMEDRGFEKIHEEQMPLVIREHQRKMQYIVAEATGWRKR